MLKEKGVSVLDATAAFRGQAWRDVYGDDCCHYTEKGNAMLASIISDRLADISAEKSLGRKDINPSKTSR